MIETANAGSSGDRSTDPHDRGTAGDPVGDAVLSFQAGRARDESFRYLYQRYFRALLGFFSRKGFQQEDCLDLTQETFVGIYQGLEAYRHEDRFEAWLYRVATTTYLKRIRAASTAKRSGMEISKDGDGLPDSALASKEGQLTGLLEAEEGARLREAVKRLPRKMRDCLVLRLYHELSYQEIATVMKLSPETVKAHLARARKRLREELGDGEPGQKEPTSGEDDD